MRVNQQWRVQTESGRVYCRRKWGLTDGCAMLERAYDFFCSLTALIYIARIAGSERMMGYW